MVRTQGGKKKLDHAEIKKRKFHCSKNPMTKKDEDINNKILISEVFPHENIEKKLGKKDFKYFNALKVGKKVNPKKAGSQLDPPVVW